MYCISMNHKIADATFRDCYALNSNEKSSFYCEIEKSKNIQGLVLLMTCNRNEVYYTGTESGFRDVENAYAKVKKISVHKIRKNFMRYDEEGSLTHLYHVACGLDSAVLGEVEIIRQIKDAYKYASESKMVDRQIHICFQGALSLAKDVAEKSLMTKLPVSVGTLTADAVVKHVENIENPLVLIVGATGTMGNIILKNLSDVSKKMRIIGTSRKHKNQIEKICDTENISVVHYDERYRYMDGADVVISATSSPHYTFLADEVQDSIIDTGKKHLFIDLAIPKDIDPDIENIMGCQIKDIDYIKELAKENNKKKYSEAEKINNLILEKVQEQRKNLLFRDYAGNVPAVKEALQDKKVATLLYQLRDNLDYESFAKVLDTIKEEEKWHISPL